MRKTITEIKTEAEAIEKVYKILPHHEVYPLVFRIEFKDGESCDVDADNYKELDLEELELFLESIGVVIEEIDLSGEDIVFESNKELSMT